MKGLNKFLPSRAGALLLALGLSACGFQLRGSYEVPAFLHEVSLKMPAGTQLLAAELRLALERRDIDPQGGEVQLEIVSENLTRQTSSVDSNARAAEYVLVYTVSFRINSSDGRAIGPLQSLILRRSYQYDPTSVVAKNMEEETLVSELRADAAQQIVRQLIALKASPLAPAPAPQAGTAP